MPRLGCVADYDAAPAASWDPSVGRYALVISQGDVKYLRTDRLKAFLDMELAALKSAERLVGKCELRVDGYNDDPRDLTHIPEVTAYFRKVSHETPLLPFLLQPAREEAMLFLALAGGGHRTATGLPAKEGDPWSLHYVTLFPDKTQLRELLLRYAEAIGEWLTEKGIVEDEEHPLWKAHEASAESFVLALQGSTRAVLQ